ncbi:MAG: hypothetical protein ACPGKG_01540 [Paracoccaceae bacterium]
MVKKTNRSSNDISVFFDAVKDMMPKTHQDLKNSILRDADKTNSELNTSDDLSVFFEASKEGVPKAHRDLETRIIRDADRAHGIMNAPRIRLWLGRSLDYLKELRGFPSAVGFTASLATGVCIGFYSPDWSGFIISFFQLDVFDEVDFIGSSFELNEIFEDT